MTNFSQEELKKIKANLEKVKHILYRKDISFYYVPSSKLREMVTKDEHPFVKALPKKIKTMIIDGTPMWIEPKMIIDLIEDKLDQRNTFMLLNGEIRVFNGIDAIIKPKK